MDRCYGIPVSGAGFAWALGSSAGLHRKPFDAKLLLQQFAPLPCVASLIAAAQLLLNAKAKRGRTNATF